MLTDSYVVIDLETTGLSLKYERIIEIGAVKVCEGEIIDTFSSFVNPGKSLPQRITELTGITQEDVEAAPYIDEVLERLLDFLGDEVLIGHNLIFDFSFIKKAAVNQGISIEKYGVDTLKIARRFLTQLESRSLGFLCGYYGISLEAHRALNDAVATHRLYQRMKAEFFCVEKDLFIAQKLVYNVKKEGPITPRQHEQLTKLAARYNIRLSQEKGITIFPPVENVNSEKLAIQKMTKNEASRLIDCLLANFGR